ncbi:cytochrome-c oxidase [Mesorhizobium sp. M7A.T.Ca.TU.009.02.1.1]|nr:cytochrome-c oxidase [Mesorhizobium sp. M7A.T.Ca.US.000.02.1.1]RUT94240.1 cytochrome-c oxidase [Mesorhizobium sp. M7A.T.Ca.US.000.02.2.1]RUU06125.1 cytochrome-c oxidase [Mesorhizobium sp. M7A.T.Ca.TU.009.02.1.1]RUU57633.1 cytochrome-c oxidase [Mesorhizobium sp. M7A.T.Ca.TU.009.01.1.1]RUU90452.1 cytochrome-c oxidase [Mesorhizobium sp. M7A.T.Ca.TU.009.01.1.2]
MLLMRTASLLLGFVTLALVWAGPLLDAWRGSFAAHMLAHMGVVAIAAPLIAIGIARPIRSVATAAPLIASLVELIVVWGWHAPAARQWAETSTIATMIEQVSFLGAGLFLWLTCMAPRNANAPAMDAAGAFALLLTSIHMTLLGALLSLASRPLYGLGEVTCFGLVLGAGQDQALGGIIMLMIGAAVYLAGGVFLLARLLSGKTERLAG